MKTSVTTLELGRFYRDVVTGFRGVAVGHSRWITGCDWVCLQPEVNQEGVMQEGKWFDISRLVSEGGGRLAFESKGPDSDRGGPQPTPKEANR